MMLAFEKVPQTGDVRARGIEVNDSSTVSKAQAVLHRAASRRS